MTDDAETPPEADRTKTTAVPPGLVLRSTFATSTVVNAVAWSRDGRLLAAACDDSKVRVWDTDSGDLRFQLTHSPTASSRWVLALAWSPSGDFIAAGGGVDGYAITIWDAATGEVDRRYEGHDDSVRSLAWSPDGDLIASSSYDRTVRLWDTRADGGGRPLDYGSEASVLALAWSPEGAMLASGSRGDENDVRMWTAGESRLLGQHAEEVLSVAWAPDGRRLASSSSDRTIRIWDPSGEASTVVLEAHTEAITSVSFDSDGRLLASKSRDETVRIWRCDTWATSAVVAEASSAYLGSSVAFHPSLPLLATLGEKDTIVRLWELDYELLLGQAPVAPPAYYTNAKVVLVGDSGVGKSGLGLVLAGQPFEPTESTHGRHVWTFQSTTVQLEDGHEESRDILLWDLAGQPGYRLIHQLHLSEVAAALIVFDARSETDPFAGVRYWDRALRQARRVETAGTTPIKKFLVAARVDRGGVGVSQERIDALSRSLEVEGYFNTSAKEGWSVPELAEAVRSAIAWDTLPRVSSTELFHSLKTFLVDEKARGRLLSTSDDLYRAYLAAPGAPAATDELRTQLETCVGLVEAQGLIRRLSFGNLVLLQPELLDSYAAGIVNAAKDEPDGMGSIAEEDARAGRFRMADSERIGDSESEQLLLIATVEDLLRHDIALREHADSGPYLVFPSQFTRVNPDLPDPEGKAVVFDFEGPVLSVYTTLAVRLAHSGVFAKNEMWKNAATYDAVGGLCGIFVREIDDGHGELTLFYSEGATDETRRQFEQYVHAHLVRRAIAESLRRRHVISCVCGYVLTDQVVRLRKERGFDWLDCPVCTRRISLDEGAPSGADSALRAIVPDIDRTADARRDLEASVSRLQGKIASGEFDVFLAHNNVDKPHVEIVARALRERGLNPWLDKEQIPPGRWFQDVIQDTIPQVKSAAVFIGTSGLGKWEALELRAFISRCVESNLPVIPVFLPGVDRLPENLRFLRELTWVQFAARVDDDAVLDDLEWGITGTHPQRARSRTSAGPEPHNRKGSGPHKKAESARKL